MTDDERKAMEWLDNLAINGGRGESYRDHARTLKAMLARPVMPEELSDELVEAIWWAAGCMRGRIATHRQVAEAIVDAIRDHLTAPRTKEVEVWRVEWAERDYKFGTDTWIAHVKQFYGEESAYEYTHGLEARKDRETRCIRVTGPHKQTVPA